MKNVLRIMVTALYVVITIETAYAGDPVSKKAIQVPSKEMFKISREKLKSLAVIPPRLPDLWSLQVRLNRVERAYNNYMQWWEEYHQALENCTERRYSAQEQRDVCRGGTSIDICVILLLRKCMNESNFGYRHYRDDRHDDVCREFRASRNQLLEMLSEAYLAMRMDTGPR